MIQNILRETKCHSIVRSYSLFFASAVWELFGSSWIVISGATSPLV